MNYNSKEYLMSTRSLMQQRRNNERESNDLKGYILNNVNVPARELVEYIISKRYCNGDFNYCKMLVADTLHKNKYYREADRVRILEI